MCCVYVEGEESELVSCSIVTNTCVVSRYSLSHVVVRKRLSNSHYCMCTVEGREG